MHLHYTYITWITVNATIFPGNLLMIHQDYFFTVLFIQVEQILRQSLDSPYGCGYDQHSRRNKSSLRRQKPCIFQSFWTKHQFCVESESPKNHAAMQKNNDHSQRLVRCSLSC